MFCAKPVLGGEKRGETVYVDELKQLFWSLLVLAITAVPLMAGSNDAKPQRQMQPTQPKRPLCRRIRTRRRA